MELGYQMSERFWGNKKILTSDLSLTHYNRKKDIVIFWVVDIYDMNVVGEKCVWLQNKERIDTHNNTVMML